MRLLMSLALAGLATVPAWAAETTALRVVNKSSLSVVALNTFPVDADGAPVEDNLGSLVQDLPPGGAMRLDLSMQRCGAILAVIGLSNRTEGRIVLDLCKDRTLTLHD